MKTNTLYKFKRNPVSIILYDLKTEDEIICTDKILLPYYKEINVEYSDLYLFIKKWEHNKEFFSLMMHIKTGHYSVIANEFLKVAK